MNRNTKKVQKLLSWGPALAALLVAAGCGSMKPFIYKPNGPITAEPPKFSAAVALVDNQSPAVPLSRTETGGNHWNFATEKAFFYMSPKRMTDYLVEDLSGSGLFSLVFDVGEGDADIIIKPTYKIAEISQYGQFTITEEWKLDMEVEVFRGEKSLLKKIYTPRWTFKYGAFAYNNHFPEVAARVPELMDEIRKDIAEALKNK